MAFVPLDLAQFRSQGHYNDYQVQPQLQLQNLGLANFFNTKVTGFFDKMMDKGESDQEKRQDKHRDTRTEKI